MTKKTKTATTSAMPPKILSFRHNISISLSAGDIKGSFEALCGDNLVDIDDFIRVMRSFGSMASAIVRNITDIDEDGHPTIEDLSLAKASLSK